MKVTVKPTVIGALGSHQRIYKESGGLEKKRTRGEHPNNNIIKISSNIKKTPEDLRRLAVAQTTVKSHKLTLV